MLPFGQKELVDLARDAWVTGASLETPSFMLSKS